MAFREDIKKWVREALADAGGEASIIQVAKHIWDNRQAELKGAGDYFYSWQYDMRWAAQRLRDKNQVGFRRKGSKNVWYLKP